MNYDMLLQLMLFCRQLEKCDEMVHVDLFLKLQNYYKTWKDCKLLMPDGDGIFEVTKRKGKTKYGCCNGCLK